MISSTSTSGAEAPAVTPSRLMPLKMAQSISAARWIKHGIGAAGALGDLDQAERVRAVGRAHHDHAVASRRDPLHRLLAVGRGVADVVLARGDHAREALLEHAHDLLGVVHRKRGLGDHGELVGIARDESPRVVCRLDQMHRAFRQLAGGADHLGMAGVPDQENFEALVELALGLDVHL